MHPLALLEGATGTGDDWYGTSGAGVVEWSMAVLPTPTDKCPPPLARAQGGWRRPVYG